MKSEAQKDESGSVYSGADKTRLKTHTNGSASFLLLLNEIHMFSHPTTELNPHLTNLSVNFCLHWTVPKS